MGEAFSSGLILPALAMGVIGWLVPRLLARIWPEGVGPLIWLALASCLLTLILTALVFALLYTWQGAPMEAIAETGLVASSLFFLRLGAISALIWAPILALSVAGIPKHWTEETW